VLLKPVQRVGIAAGAGREAGAPKPSAALVKHSEVMGLGVRVDATDDNRWMLRHVCMAVLPVRQRAAWSGGRTEQ
jgi:hypothetical protein